MGKKRALAFQSSLERRRCLETKLALLLGFRFDLFHWFAATDQVARRATTWVVNHDDEPALVALVFGTLFCHAVSPPLDLTLEDFLCLNKI
jgi:hypothetical protein